VWDENFAPQQGHLPMAYHASQWEEQPVLGEAGPLQMIAQLVAQVRLRCQCRPHAPEVRIALADGQLLPALADVQVVARVELEAVNSLHPVANACLVLVQRLSKQHQRPREDTAAIFLLDATLIRPSNQLRID
jgi:hypothetical protein